MGRAPVVARVAPFGVFVLLTACQGLFGPVGQYWVYALKTIVGALLVWGMIPVVSELRLKFSPSAVLVGAAVFGLWVGLESPWTTQPQLWVKIGLLKPPTNSPPVWNPHEHFGHGTCAAWFFVLTRILGSTFVVPPIEEVFYRSFLYRYILKTDFLSMPLNRFAPTAFLLSALIFGFAHREWFAGILCAMAYQGLVIWKNRLGDAIAAHAVTNLLLGLWVVGRNQWQFW